MIKKHTILSNALLLCALAVATTVSAVRTVAATSLPTVRVLATDPIALQGGSAGTFTIVRLGSTTSAVTVNYTITGTAVSGTDYAALSNAVTLAAGQTVAHIAVTPLVNDTSFGASDKTVNLTLAVGSTYNVTLPAEAGVTIIADRTPPAFVRIVSPHPGQVVQEGTSVTVDVEVADPDNATKVELFVNGSSLASVTTSPYIFTIPGSIVAPGTYALTAKVTDILGQVDTSGPVTVIVNNFAPTVTLVSPANGTSVSVPPTVMLQAIATDQDDPVAKVDFLDLGKVVGTVNNSTNIVNNTYTLTLANVANGTHVYTARAVDAFGKSTVSGPSTVTVSNALPVISLVSPLDDATFGQNTTIQLHAVATDPDDAVVQVDFFANNTTLLGTVFKLGSGTNNPDAYLNVNNLAPGTYRVTARATDQFGRQTTSGTIHITVTNVVPTITLVSPINSALVDPPTVALQAIATDGDDAIQKVEFLIDGKVVATVNNGTNIVSGTYNASYSFLGPDADGIHTVLARATDVFGAQTSTAPVSVTVLDFPPDVQLLTPVNGALIGVPPTVVFTAVAGDADEHIDHVDFIANNKVIATVTTTTLGILPNNTNTYAYTWNNVASGNYSVAIKAVDVFGRTTLSDIHLITVNNQAPVVDLVSPIQGTIYSGAPATVVLHAVATDADDTVVKVEFYEGATLLGTTFKVGSGTSNPDAFLTLNNVAPGAHGYYAKAYDPYGVSTKSDSVFITVNNPGPVVSIVNPTNNTEIVTPPNVSLQAVATSASGISKVVFSDGGSTVGTVNNSTSVVNNTYVLNLNNVATGRHLYKAVASDIYGAQATSTIITVLVTNVAPTVTLVGLTNGTTLAYPVSLQLHAQATDPDDGVTQIQFLVDNTVVGTVFKIGSAITNNPDAFVTVNNLTIGTHTITVTANDPYGRKTTLNVSVNVSIEATPAPDQAASSSGSGSSAGGSTATATATISSLVSLPDGGYQLTITGAVGAKANIQASSNFVDWTSLTTVVVGSNGSVQYTDQNTAGGRRFYRLAP
ncbi:MAG: beta strand repeat-containing protein [Limisphaerales bacterium]